MLEDFLFSIWRSSINFLNFVFFDVFNVEIWRRCDIKNRKFILGSACANSEIYIFLQFFEFPGIRNFTILGRAMGILKIGISPGWFSVSKLGNSKNY